MNALSFGLAAAFVACGLGAPLAASPARATSEILLRISQPFESCEGDCFEIREVTYVVHLGLTTQGMEVEYTCVPGFAVVHGHPENRNAANLAGVTLRLEGPADIENRTDGKTNREFPVDTLTMWLDFTRARDEIVRSVPVEVARMESLWIRRPDQSAAERSRAIAAHALRDVESKELRLVALADVTIECALDNAARGFVRLPALRVRCVGLRNAAYADTVIRVRPKEKLEFSAWGGQEE